MKLHEITLRPRVPPYWVYPDTNTKIELPKKDTIYKLHVDYVLMHPERFKLEGKLDNYNEVFQQVFQQGWVRVGPTFNGILAQTHDVLDAHKAIKMVLPDIGGHVDRIELELENELYYLEGRDLEKWLRRPLELPKHTRVR